MIKQISSSDLSKMGQKLMVNTAKIINKLTGS